MIRMLDGIERASRHCNTPAEPAPPKKISRGWVTAIAKHMPRRAISRAYPAAADKASNQKNGFDVVFPARPQPNVRIIRPIVKKRARLLPPEIRKMPAQTTAPSAT